MVTPTDESLFFSDFLELTVEKERLRFHFEGHSVPSLSAKLAGKASGGTLKVRLEVHVPWAAVTGSVILSRIAMRRTRIVPSFNLCVCHLSVCLSVCIETSNAGKTALLVWGESRGKTV